VNKVKMLTEAELTAVIGLSKGRLVYEWFKKEGDSGPEGGKEEK
jgi:hypothetical protein